ncbi:MAG: 3-phosphoserine/phosphohydroxythreonine transaminase [Spirochaeta sp.]|jgi:phosphoserine aminotransferase|nr:3-phosphoserine/phosphohydroxythreonine transaminase [Spirochaeta sp.]
MARVFNFYAGPATLPLPVLEAAQADLVDYRGSGLSLIETSHRSNDYDEVHASAQRLIRELLGVPDGYSVLFLGGGATMQFGMIPMNLMTTGRSDLVLSGVWAQKALDDAKKYGTVSVVYDGSDTKFSTLPAASSVASTRDSSYLHITSNETIDGIQWKEFPTVDAPLVADMSSDILSRPVPVERFGLIYAGAQKNLGPAGVTIVIIRDDLLERSPADLPIYLRYPTHAKKDSLYNTPPVFPIYIVNLVLQWIVDNGGLAGIAERNRRKADALYQAIADSDGFYRSPVDPAVRSDMNVVFRLPDEEQEKKFVAGAAERGMIGLKGHRSVGGVRASIYNAMPEAGVETLIAYMNEFHR